MPEEPNRTVHAQQAFEFTEVFAYKFDPVVFGRAHPRRLKLFEPDGPSTAGGKQARQSLVLVPDGSEGKNLVIGWIDVTQKAAELRSYGLVAQQFKARFGSDIDLSREEYESLLDDLRSFLKIQKISQRVAEAAAGPKVPARQPAPPAPSPAAGNGPMLAMLGIGILIGFGLGFLVFRLL